MLRALGATNGVEQDPSAGGQQAAPRHLSVPMFHAPDPPAQPQARLGLENGARECEGAPWGEPHGHRSLPWAHCSPRQTPWPTRRPPAKEGQRLEEGWGNNSIAWDSVCRSFWKSSAGREQCWEVLVGLHSRKDPEGRDGGMEVARRDGGEEGDQTHTTFPACTQMGTRSLCCPLSARNWEETHRNTSFVFLFCPPMHTGWLCCCHIFAFFYALKSVHVLLSHLGGRGLFLKRAPGKFGEKDCF